MSINNKAKQSYGRIKSEIMGFSSIALHLSLFTLGGLFVLPILLFLMNSIRGGGGVFTESYAIPEQVSFQNYMIAWFQDGFQHYMMNSIFVVGISLLLILVCSTLAAYALVRFDFKGRYLVTALILAGFMIPTQILFIPRYAMMSMMGLLDTHTSLILVYVASALPFSIFLLRQFFIDIPESLAEAARLDGCSDFQILVRIYLPLAIPAVSAVLIFQFVVLWNEFLYAFSFISTDLLQTLPAGLMGYQGAYGTDWPKMMAGVGISVIPTLIVFLLFRNQFINSINMQAKG